METYQKVADTVGLVPSLNIRDNMLQGAVVLAGTVVGAGIGLAMGASQQAALVGALVGLVGSGLLSGFVLMITGMVRATKK